MAKHVAPSLLSANRNDLFNEAKKALDVGCEYVHFDVMDGRFVPNTSFSLEELRSLEDLNIKKDVHIMIEEPLKFAPFYLDAGADILTFHLEAVKDLEEGLKVARLIKNRGVLAGISIKPATPVSALYPYLESGLFDLVLVMSVEPGKGGQAFIPESLEKIKELHSYPNRHFIIEVDGGINEVTGPLALKAGADLLVAGSYLYGHDDFKERIEKLKK